MRRKGQKESGRRDGWIWQNLLYLHVLPPLWVLILFSELMINNIITRSVVEYTGGFLPIGFHECSLNSLGVAEVTPGTHLVVPLQSNTIAIHYRPTGFQGSGGQHGFDQITRKKDQPPGFTSVQFHELTLR